MTNSIIKIHRSEQIAHLDRALVLSSWAMLALAIVTLVAGVTQQSSYLQHLGGIVLSAFVFARIELALLRRRLVKWTMILIHFALNLLVISITVLTPLGIPVIGLYSLIGYVVNAQFVEQGVLRWLTASSLIVFYACLLYWLVFYLQESWPVELFTLVGFLISHGVAMLLIKQGHERSRSLLDRVQSANLALEEIRDQLEQQVATRTEELGRIVSLLRATLESTTDGILVVDTSRKFVVANQKFYDLWRVPQELAEARDTQQLLVFIGNQLIQPDEYYARTESLHISLDSTTDIVAFKDGRVFERYTQPQYIDGQQVGRVWSFCDITQRVRAERRSAILTYLGQRLSGASDVETAARIIIGVADDLLHWESCYLDLYNVETNTLDTIIAIDIIDGQRTEIPQMPLAEIGPMENKIMAEGALLILRAPDTGKKHNLISFGDTTRPSESLIYVPIRRGNTPVGVLSIQSYQPFAYTHDDVQTLQGLADHCGAALERIATEEALRRSVLEGQELERKMLETQKLESLGVLAGGVAHDFNNLLTVVLGNIYLAQLDLEMEHPATSSLRQVERAARRAADLTQQMLAYAGKGQLSIQQFDLNTLIVEMESLLRASLPRHVRVMEEFAPALPLIEGDATQIRQIVMNLLVNAAEAIGEYDGQVVLRTGVAHFEQAALRQAAVGANLEAGVYVFLEVCDNGSGMDAATLRKIFEPFFSTKFTGRGLGLASVLGIARSHQGAILVESTPGVGTVFQVLLPPAARASAPALPERGEERWAGRGAVLVIDDEVALTSMVGRMLGRFGFETLAATDGPQGIAHFRQRAESLVLVLLDLTMPGMSGQHVLQELQAIDSTVPILIMSGYSEQDARRGFNGEAAGFLHKPFGLGELRTAIQNVLGSAIVQREA